MKIFILIKGDNQHPNPMSDAKMMQHCIEIHFTPEQRCDNGSKLTHPYEKTWRFQTHYEMRLIIDNS